MHMNNAALVNFWCLLSALYKGQLTPFLDSYKGTQNVVQQLQPGAELAFLRRVTTELRIQCEVSWIKYFETLACISQDMSISPFFLPGSSAHSSPSWSQEIPLICLHWARLHRTPGDELWDKCIFCQLKTATYTITPIVANCPVLNWLSLFLQRLSCKLERCSSCNGCTTCHFTVA